MEAVLAVPIAVGFGYWADSHFDTAPRYLLVGAVIGFCAMVLRLVRLRPGDGSAEATEALEASDETIAGTPRPADDAERNGSTDDEKVG
jgi:F0F1-type ATP synthase assembly protein I